MDNLTHSLVGLFLARVGFSRLTQRGAAVMVVAANAPDFDVVSWLGGSTTYIVWHRHITHSLIAVPVMAALAVLIVRVAGRKKLNWLRAWLIAMIAVLSHLLLDLTNVYGVRLLLPFSGRWFHFDITPVIDFVLWIVILLGVAAPALTRLVGSEIGEKRPEAGRAGWAFTALLLFAGYDYGRSILHDRAVAVMDSHVFNGLAPRRVAAFPTENPLSWTGTAELSNAYVQGPVDLRFDFHEKDFETFYKSARSPAIDAALTTPPFQAFLQFVQYPLWVADPERVSLYDLRFGNPREPGFFANAVVSQKNQVVSSGFSMAGARPR